MRMGFWTLFAVLVLGFTMSSAIGYCLQNCCAPLVSVLVPVGERARAAGEDRLAHNCMSC
eukprot:3216637-Amphidinium_carterae.1